MHVTGVGSDPHDAHGDKARLVKHDGIGQPRHRVGKHKCPPPPFTGTNEEHARDADEFTSEKDPRPYRFVFHDVEYVEEIAAETANI